MKKTDFGPKTIKTALIPCVLQRFQLKARYFI